VRQLIVAVNKMDTTKVSILRRPGCRFIIITSLHQSVVE
jgi:translation elongation factor EF-1alpha